ncbi:oxidoreductase [Thalassospira profundimaris]|nr:oxidoreductase [Thalassospira profundimaris]
MVNYAMIGAAGYIAPRHMKAIRETGGSLEVAFDPNDSVGIIDSHFPQARFFTEFERFDRHLDKMRRSGKGVDFVTICSPNYLHDAHVRFALRSSADAICEKPLVLNPWNIDGLREIEEHSDKRVYTILQLRLHPAIIELKNKIAANPDRIHDVQLTYITSRGNWYDASWKGDLGKSGGIATNIGVHFYDMLGYVFGERKHSVVHLHEDRRASGYLEFSRARVSWYLSISSSDLPEKVQENQTTYRSITVDGREVEFSGGFTDLHTLSYQEILSGNGFSLEDVRPSIELVSSIRSQVAEPNRGDVHPFARALLRG